MNVLKRLFGKKVEEVKAEEVKEVAYKVETEEIKTEEVIKNVIDAVKTEEVKVDNVYDYYKQYQPYRQYQPYKELAKRPIKEVNENTLNIVFFKQSVLNGIMSKCLPQAGDSEFQFHYRALQVKISNGENRIVLTIPTIFFNFSQTVTSVTVDYNLTEVSEISEQIKPVSRQLAKQYMKQLNDVIQFFKAKDFEVKFVEEEMGSIHRHPGRFGFSGTDLDDNPLSPGIIYRNKKASDLIQTDSVLYCAADAELFTTETRIFNISPVDDADEDKGVEGTVATAKTLCYILQDEVNGNEDPFKAFFEEETEDVKWVVNSFQDAKEYKAIKGLIAEFISGYTPAEAINPELIKREIPRYGNINSLYGNYGIYETSSADYGDLFEWEKNKKSSESSSINLKDLKEELMMELNFKEPTTDAVVNSIQHYLNDVNIMMNLFDIYDYYKNNKGKVSADFKGGLQILMNPNGGRIIF